MKKALVLLLALTLVGGLMFAEDEVVPRSDAVPTISGYGKVTWGANFNGDISTGFKNEAELTVTFPLISQDSTTHGGDAITGEITISDLSLSLVQDLDTGDAEDDLLEGDGNNNTNVVDSVGDITAKILFPNAIYLKIHGAPGFELNNAQSLATLYNDGSWDDARSILKANIVPATTGGITIGMTGNFNFAFKFASVGDYNTNLNNRYAAGLDIGYTVTDLMTVAAGAAYGVLDPEVGNIIFTAKVTVNPKDSGLTAVAAIDGQYTAAEILGFDSMFTVDYTMAKMFSVGAGAYLGDANTTADGGTILDARVRAALLAVENLTAEAAVDMWDLIADPANDPMLVFIDGRLSYVLKQGDVNYIKPYAEVGYALTGSTANGGTLAAKVGVEAKQFPRTVLVAQYTAGSFPGDNTVTSTNRAFTDDHGTFIVSAKVTY